jgi:hypothetical protein
MEKVPALGLAMLTLGIFELAWCAFCVFGGLFLGLAGPLLEEMPMYVFVAGGLAYLLLAVAALLMGIIHVVAGWQLWKGRGRILGIVGLAVCAVSMILALYCAPISLSVLVLGIVVYVDPKVHAAFDEAEKG